MSLRRPPLLPQNNTPTSPFNVGSALMHKPSHSSPLAGSSPPGGGGGSGSALFDYADVGSSPTIALQARRRSQYKSAGPSTDAAPTTTRMPRLPPLILGFPRRPSGGADLGAGASMGDDGDASQAAFLRTRLKKRCIERAAQARERAVNRKRGVQLSSDGFDAEMDVEDEEDEDPLADELYSRIMRNQTRKMRRAYLHAYDREVGSSDPALEEPQEWEDELGNSTSNPPAQAADEAEAERELQEYLEAEALADFADLAPEDLDFEWDDVDDNSMDTS
ncbi:hypothetical protein MKEN_00632800 [Mycena kentingensis (nom. inval.)]|nr:hypothetical protein MKEN_00632800 [Mycena kentingensis (nom. inval.)]